MGVIGHPDNSTLYYNMDMDYINRTLLDGDRDLDRDSERRVVEAYRLIVLTVIPLIIVIGTLGNLLTFIVMRRRFLRYVSTCFYMSILALVDTG